MTTTLSSREFNQDTSGAKKAAKEGPVIITDRGRPAHVLLSIEDYLKLTGSAASIADLLAMPEDIEFEPQRAAIAPRPVDLS
ncbi:MULTISPECIES: type II toxin-antitoxin system Phd/YefM family antitoxin [Pseudomonas syringae group]|uniref:Antitoxin n=1 Tax=Pseudomonas syringae pv. primulae TaxID=251707 RepID=A0A0Q0D1G8_9PSED|nr:MULTISPECIES: type II toxin-antitoxin system Phd/YefM family antitoxin [Pseudomonas syringae group]KPY33090.1 Prevent-host-death family protein [Pseudomonas syringae pv. primulae]MBD8186857.1 type II toxin-antitoxin system Phd/YefM family antitoxin [Pseudomonas viridiflava]MBD8200215.1 type II toxin-antitoxin system Phd/YefM family antitoxin [Pseudomonas viridiflava]MBI6577121.1 type II toxin-antitoxin system Phd/YefM family antitoxin [Pseudomonas viridiflava]MBI6608153.1 type II toxin-anti